MFVAAGARSGTQRPEARGFHSTATIARLDPDGFMPEVSVIIPTHNYGRFLAEAIQSVLDQTCAHWDLLVVDDGSTDDTRQVVAPYEHDARVRYLFQKNGGDAAARNTGVRNSTGRQLAFLDSDDLWLPEKLARQLAILRERPEVGIVHTAVVLQQIDERRREVSRLILARPALREKTLYEELLYRNVITGSHSSVMVRREVLERAGLFDEAFRIGDIDMWQRLARHEQFFCLDEPLTVLRKHGGNATLDTALTAENRLRHFAKLSRDIPPEHRHHLPRVAVSRFSGLALSLLLRGRFRLACVVGGKALGGACRCPGYAFGLAVRAMSSRIWRTRSTPRR